MKLKKPNKTDFSDIRLEKCFSLTFLNKLKNLSDKREEFLVELGDFLGSIDSNLPSYELKKIEALCRINVGLEKSVLLMDKSAKGTRLFYEKYNEKKECLICKNKRVQDCHILKRSFFKNQKRLRVHYKLFRNHFGNLTPLCPNHHDILDKTSDLSQGKINKIARHNKKLVNKMSKDIDRELKNLNRGREMLKKLQSSISVLISQKINKALNKVSTTK